MNSAGSGTSVLGQYQNIGTVTAQSVMGPVTDSDTSHYLGVAAVQETPTPHGDGKTGEAVPRQPGSTFLAGCAVSGP
jgi:hypothetical protein